VLKTLYKAKHSEERTATETVQVRYNKCLEMWLYRRFVHLLI